MRRNNFPASIPLLVRSMCDALLKCVAHFSKDSKTQMKYRIFWLYFLLFIAGISALPFAQNLHGSSQVPGKSELAIGQPAPSFFLKSLSGEDFFLRDHCGKPRQVWQKKTQRVVVMSFFATYCLPCLKEIPALHSLSEEFKEKALFILIDLKEEPDKVNAYVAKHHIHLSILLDRFGVVAEKYGVNALPSLFIIDQQGIVRHIQRGYQKNLAKDIRGVIAKY